MYTWGFAKKTLMWIWLVCSSKIKKEDKRKNDVSNWSRVDFWKLFILYPILFLFLFNEIVYYFAYPQWTLYTKARGRADHTISTASHSNSRSPGSQSTHLPDSQARCSRGHRPSLAESVLSSTYWGREDDLDIEYSLIFQPDANLMLAHCLRHWPNINPTLPHVTYRVWWDVVGAVCDTSCEVGGHQTCAA